MDGRDKYMDQNCKILEQEKWNNYYHSLPLDESDEVTQSFNDELVARISALVPPGSKILEAGCGGGWQSLALARSGKFQVSLMDFSDEALHYARQLFEREQVSAEFILGDASTQGEPNFDLVFNAGVLEHYNLAEQRAFLQGMASRSRNFVLALVPNRLCYWYWLWRIQKAGGGQWPFGKEAPLVDFSSSYRAAGIQFLGQTFMGKAWTETFISSLSGMDRDLCEEITQIHRSPLIPEAQQSYLIAGLGSVLSVEPKIPAIWKQSLLAEDLATAELSAAFADALALRISAEQKLGQLQLKDEIILEREKGIAWLREELATSRKEIERLTSAHTLNQATQQMIAAMKKEEDFKREQFILTQSAEIRELHTMLTVTKKESEQTSASYKDSLARQKSEYEKKTRELQAELQDKAREIQALKEQTALQEKLILVRDEGIAWLRDELAAAQAKARQKLLFIPWRMNRADSPATPSLLRHPLDWLGQQNSYWRFRRGVKRLLFPILPDRARRHVQRIFHYSKRYVAPAPLSGQNVLDARVVKEVARHSDVNKKGDSFQSLTLLPAIEQSQLLAALDHHHLPARPLHRADVICFSIVDWETRYQRPQQLMSQFAAHGHRVFYISTSRFQTAHMPSRNSVQMIKENVYEISLAVQHSPDVYGEAISGANQASMLASLDELRQTFQIDEAIGYVMIASWGNVAIEAQKQWGWRIIYDCMDEWENFPGIKLPVLNLEKSLVKACDLLVVTAQRLFEKWRGYQRSMVLARNATDYDFYSQRCVPNNILEKAGRPVVGYFGAIADWFDVELMVYVAASRPQYTFVLLGGVFDVDVSSLKALPNVQLLGQRPYETMPQYLYHFDACIIPFKINPITEATDPVKLYEYFSGGKPVVSVALPEVEQYRDYVYLATDKEDFAAKLDTAIAENTPEQALRRQALARQHTWGSRFQQITNGLAEITPRASIIIVTYNNLVLNKLCLESIIRNTQYPSYEVIVVDNNSTDDTPTYLHQLKNLYPNVKVILNSTNYGFARANNQGIAQSTGDYLVLLNNDTIVPPGWLSRLLRHLNNPAIGMVGPVTNFVGNEAKIEVPYQTWEGMEAFAREHTWANDGRVADIHMLAMFCVAMRRTTYDLVGPLDEQFGIGMFEDDDYARRVKENGLRVICAADVFVHHFGQAAFKKLIENGHYDRLFNENRRLYEAKWNVKWIPRGHAPVRFERA
jgi:GT2 family glycosyltransferase/SAM-dependent methyltransferase